MNEERKKELRRNIRRLTKLIGEAKKANDFNEIDNIRRQRGDCVKQLVEEFDEAFIIENGKTIFLPIEEAVEHHERPDVQKKVVLANAVNDVCQQRKSVKARYDQLSAMASDELKAFILKETIAHLKNIESMIDSIKKELGETPINWNEIDKKDDDFMKGIDTSSLM